MPTSCSNPVDCGNGTILVLIYPHFKMQLCKMQNYASKLRTLGVPNILTFLSGNWQLFFGPKKLAYIDFTNLTRLSPFSLTNFSRSASRIIERGGNYPDKSSETYIVFWYEPDQRHSQETLDFNNGHLVLLLPWKGLKHITGDFKPLGGIRTNAKKARV